MDEIIIYSRDGVPATLQGQELQDLLHDPAKLASAIRGMEKNLARLKDLQRMLYPETDKASNTTVVKDESWQCNEVLRAFQRTGAAMSAKRLYWTYLRRSMDYDTVRLRCEELVEQDKLVKTKDKRSPEGRYSLPKGVKTEKESEDSRLKTDEEEEIDPPIGSITLKGREISMRYIDAYLAPGKPAVIVANHDKDFIFPWQSDEGARLLELGMDNQSRYVCHDDPCPFLEE